MKPLNHDQLFALSRKLRGVITPALNKGAAYICIAQPDPDCSGAVVATNLSNEHVFAILLQVMQSMDEGNICDYEGPSSDVESHQA